MFNLLIVENNSNILKNLFNNISYNVDNIVIRSIAYSGSDLIEVIESQNIDLMIIDSLLLDVPSINFLNSLNLNTYSKSIIIIGNSNCNLLQNSYVFKHIYNSDNISEITDTLCNLVTSKLMLSENIKKQITNELVNLSFNTSYIGTQYLIETIFYSYIDKSLIENLNKNIYPILIQKYNTNLSNIKSDIFQAIIQSYYSCDEKYLNSYLNRVLLSKPKTKDIILGVLEHMT